MNYLFEGYEFKINELCEMYDTISHKGITYHLPEGKFDICLNKIGLARIIINYIDSSWKDLPFNSETLYFLPESIKVRKIK